MKEISTSKSLLDKLKEKREEDTRAVTELTLKDQEQLKSDLVSQSKDAVSLMLKGTEKELETRFGNIKALALETSSQIKIEVESQQATIRRSTAEQTQSIELGTSQQVTLIRTANKTVDTLLKTQQKDVTTTIKGIAAQIAPAAQEAQKATAALKGLTQATKKAWLFSLALPLSVFIIICASLWGIVQYQVSKIIANDQSIEAQETTIRNMKSQTWGIELVKYPDGTKYIMLPLGASAKSGSTIGDRPALQFWTN